MDENHPGRVHSRADGGQVAEHASRVPSAPRNFVPVPARLWIRLPVPRRRYSVSSFQITTNFFPRGRVELSRVADKVWKRRRRMPFRIYSRAGTTIKLRARNGTREACSGRHSPATYCDPSEPHPSSIQYRHQLSVPPITSPPHSSIRLPYSSPHQAHRPELQTRVHHVPA